MTKHYTITEMYKMIADLQSMVVNTANEQVNNTIGSHLKGLTESGMYEANVNHADITDTIFDILSGVGLECEYTPRRRGIAVKTKVGVYVIEFVTATNPNGNAGFNAKVANSKEHDKYIVFVAPKADVSNNRYLGRMADVFAQNNKLAHVARELLGMQDVSQETQHFMADKVKIDHRYYVGGVTQMVEFLTKINK